MSTSSYSDYCKNELITSQESYNSSQSSDDYEPLSPRISERGTLLSDGKLVSVNRLNQTTTTFVEAQSIKIAALVSVISENCNSDLSILKYQVIQLVDALNVMFKISNIPYLEIKKDKNLPVSRVSSAGSAESKGSESKKSKNVSRTNSNESHDRLISLTKNSKKTHDKKSEKSLSHLKETCEKMREKCFKQVPYSQSLTEAVKAKTSYTSDEALELKKCTILFLKAMNENLAENELPILVFKEVKCLKEVSLFQDCEFSEADTKKIWDTMKDPLQKLLSKKILDLKSSFLSEKNEEISINNCKILSNLFKNEKNRYEILNLKGAKLIDEVNKINDIDKVAAKYGLMGLFYIKNHVVGWDESLRVAFEKHSDKVDMKSALESLKVFKAEHKAAKGVNKQLYKDQFYRQVIFILDSYQEKMMSVANELNMPFGNTEFAKEIIALFKEKNINNKESISEICHAISKSIKIHHIEGEITKNIISLQKKMMDDKRDLNEEEYTFKPMMEKQWDLLSKATFKGIKSEWDRHLRGGFLTISDSSGNPLLAPPDIISKPNLSEDEKKEVLNQWVIEAEKIISQKTFNDPKGTLLTNFREIINKILEEQMNQMKGEDSHVVKLKNEFILDVHERIFNIFGPAIQAISEKKPLDPNVIQLLEKVNLQLIEQNPEAMKNLEISQIAIYLLTFYRSLKQEFMIGLLTLLKDMYNHVYPYDVSGITSLDKWSSNEEDAWKTNETTKINIRLTDGIIFTWIKIRQLYEGCLVSQRLIITVPGIHSKELQGKVEQKFISEILDPERANMPEIEKRLRRISQLLKVAEFPEGSLLMSENI